MRVISWVLPVKPFSILIPVKVFKALLSNYNDSLYNLFQIRIQNLICFLKLMLVLDMCGVFWFCIFVPLLIFVVSLVKESVTILINK